MLLQVARVPRKKKEKRGGFNSRPLISCVYNEKEVRKKEEAKDGGKHREVEKLKRLYYIQRGNEGGEGGGGGDKKKANCRILNIESRFEFNFLENLLNIRAR